MRDHYIIVSKARLIIKLSGFSDSSGTAKLLCKWWGCQVTQSWGGGLKHFFSVTLYDFLKKGVGHRAIALPSLLPPRSLFVCTLALTMHENTIKYKDANTL